MPDFLQEKKCHAHGLKHQLGYEVVLYSKRGTYSKSLPRGGHFGIKKTGSKVSERYSWSGIVRDVMSC